MPNNQYFNHYASKLNITYSIICIRRQTDIGALRLPTKSYFKIAYTLRHEHFCIQNDHQRVFLNNITIRY